MRIRKVLGTDSGRQASRPLLISLKVRRMLMRTSPLNKLMSIGHRMTVKVKSEFLDSLRIKSETLQENQSVRNIDSNPYTLENDMKNMGSRMLRLKPPC